MKKWKDETTYRRDDTDRTPRTWVLKAATVKLVVTRMIGCGDSWFFRCHELGIDCLEFGSKDVDACKAEAVSTARRILEEALDALHGDDEP